MILQDLQPPASGKKRWQCRFSDGSLLQLPLETVADCGLYAGMELTQESWEHLRQAGERAELLQYALALLGRRSYSQGELREKLRSKKPCPDWVDEVLARCRQLGLIDDAAYAGQLAARLGEKGYGPARLRQEFFRRKIAREHWDAALEQLPTGEGAIDRYLARHLPANPEPKEKKRAADALARRGFSWEDIWQGLRRHCDSWEGTEEEDRWGE